MLLAATVSLGARALAFSRQGGGQGSKGCLQAGEVWAKGTWNEEMELAVFWTGLRGGCAGGWVSRDVVCFGRGGWVV